MKILVTGGDGFIGSNLVRLLIKETGKLKTIAKITTCPLLTSPSAVPIRALNL